MSYSHSLHTNEELFKPIASNPIEMQINKQANIINESLNIFQRQ